MKLRMLHLTVETTVRHNAGSRRYPKIEERVDETLELKLQFFSDFVGDWVDVPTEHEHTTRYRDIT